ncbi:Uncharacterised protein [uncultured archaeon]|nr:Uncharacterised protein [uncultured archaeon]
MTSELYVAKSNEIETSNQFLTNVPTKITKGTPPFMRQSNRWEYLKEFIDEFYIVGKKAEIMFVLTTVLGIAGLNYFLPGALLTLALAGRYYGIAWWGHGVAKKFGQQRTIMLTT